ncbi:MAG: hypothetical protein Q8T13_05125 [Acidobacteriota bacterium]|nr:hypothetical protein [Acidobacteriota bacterium]
MTNSRATCRAGHRCEPATEREAWHCQVMHAKDAVDVIAGKEGIHEKTLTAMVNPDRDDAWVPARRQASILDRTADNDAVARFYAARVGGFFFRPPTVVDSADAALVSAISEQTKELSEAVSAIDRALRTGGGITADELPTINREIDDMVEAALRLKATVKRSALLTTRASVPLRNRS